MNDELAYSESTYCEIRCEAIRTNEMHMHYVGPDGKTHCDKMVGIGVGPSRADLFKSFATAIVSGDEDAMRTISEGVEAQQRAAEASETFSMEVPDGDNGETKTITFPAMVEGQDRWGLYGAVGGGEYSRLNLAVFGDGDGSAPIYEEMKPEEYSVEYHDDGTATMSILPKRVAEAMADASWKCTNHPPGSEIDVPVGEACYCGRVV
jgi:hypothetical protein